MSARVKIRTTVELRPGMVVRGAGSFPGTPLHPFRQVAAVTKPTPWAERQIAFTDGTRVLCGNGGEFEVAHSKSARNAAKARAGIIRPFALADALGALLGAYARSAVTR